MKLMNHHRSTPNSPQGQIIYPKILKGSFHISFWDKASVIQFVFPLTWITPPSPNARFHFTHLALDSFYLGNIPGLIKNANIIFLC